jgi:hypothetical protein
MAGRSPTLCASPRRGPTWWCCAGTEDVLSIEAIPASVQVGPIAATVAAGTNANTFRLTVTQTVNGIAGTPEEFNNLVMDDTATRYALTVVNAGSQLVQLTRRSAIGTNTLPDNVADVVVVEHPVASAAALQTAAQQILLVEALAVGAAGDNITVEIAAGANPGTFRLIVVGDVGGQPTTETFDDLSMHEANPRYALIVVNGAVDGSQLVQVERLSLPGALDLPAVAAAANLQGGTTTAASTLTLESAAPAAPVDLLRISAANPGVWGDALRVSVTPGDTAGTFGLVVNEVVNEQSVATEEFFNLNLTANDPRNAVAFVNAQSTLVRLAAVAGAPANPVFGAVAGRPLTGGADGGGATAAALIGNVGIRTGINALERLAPNIFNILCLPAAADLPAADMSAVYNAARTFCRTKRAFLIVDIPETTGTPPQMEQWLTANNGLRDDHAAVYFPRLNIPDPLDGNRPRSVAASGTLAGVYARTDGSRGIWKAPAGIEAVLRNATVAFIMNDLQNGVLNRLGVNCLRNFPIHGNVSWGARTLNGADAQASEYKYVPVRRTALFIAESLFQGLQWVVFEPNDAQLWSQIRLNVGAFMNTLFRQGAFQGGSAREAYFVKCDQETTTQNDIDRGIVNIVVGFAPLKPAEFVVVRIQQMAGQVQA